MNRIVRPSPFSSPHQREQFVDLRRRQHGGRLVEDQDVGAAIEQAQEFLKDLPPMDRRVRDQGAPIELDAGERGEPVGLVLRRAPAASGSAPA